MYGNTARSIIFVWLISTATNIPRTIEISRPIRATFALDQRESRIPEKMSQSRNPFWRTSCGGRRRKRRRGISTT